MMNAQEMNGTFIRGTIDQRLRRVNLDYCRIYIFFVGSAFTTFMLWLALTSFFSIEEDSIIYGNQNSNKILLEITNPSMIYIAAIFTLFGSLSLLIWELRIERNKMIDNTPHRLFRLAIVCAIIALSIWNGTIQHTLIWVIQRLLIYLMVVMECTYHTMLSVQLCQIDQFIRHISNEENNNDALEMGVMGEN